MSADPTAEHIDAVAKVAADYVGAGEYPSDPHGPNCYDVARRCECASDIAADILTSTDAAVHAAMLDALVRAGVLVRTTITANNATVSILAERIEVAP